jgi:hypothetical protein
MLHQVIRETEKRGLSAMVCDRSVVLQKDLFLLQMCNSMGGCMVGSGLQCNGIIWTCCVASSIPPGKALVPERSGRREIPANNTDAWSSQQY